eukprot:m.39789 g.39789  ORF g.39789 m.39789 type:complete len:401 (-) comp9592_c0_seq2:67-1269(-)
MEFKPVVILLLSSYIAVASSSGSTLTARFINTSSAAVGMGCQMATLNLENPTNPSQTALSGPIDSNCEQNTVAAIGVVSPNQFFVSSKSVLKHAVLDGTEFQLHEVLGFNVSSNNSVFGVVRISDSIQLNNMAVSFVALSTRDGRGRVMAIACLGSEDVANVTHTYNFNSFGASDVKVVAINNKGTNDESLNLAVSVDTGISLLRYDTLLGFLEISFIDTSTKNNDGIAVQKDKGVILIASGGDGMIVVDYGSKSKLGQVSIPGWSGGVSLGTDGLAYVAADKGLYTVNIKTPSKPYLSWTCELLGSGLGWNVDVSQTSHVALLADTHEGLQIISVNNHHVMSHFGNGTQLACKSVTKKLVWWKILVITLSILLLISIVLCMVLNSQRRAKNKYTSTSLE